MATKLLLLTLIITSVLSCSLGFVLRRRDWEAEDDTNNGLREALPLLREEQRRLDVEGVPEKDFWPKPDLTQAEEEEALELVPRLGEDDVVFNSLLENEEEGDDEDVFVPQTAYVQDVEEQEENIIRDLIDKEEDNSVSDITQSPADMEELESILEPSDDEKVEDEVMTKRNIPKALGGPGPGRPKRREEDLERKINALLEKAEEEEEEDEEQEYEKEDESDEDPTPVPVSTEELEAVLSDDENDSLDEIAPTDIVQEEEEEDDEELPPQEEILPPMSYAPMMPLKIKRSSGNISPPTELLAEDGIAAREYIRHFLELEDDENTNLANALNLATMAQVSSDDKLVLPEARYIRKAIKDEQAIQELRSELSSPSSLVVSAAKGLAKREVEVNPDVEEEEEGEKEYLPEDEENMIPEMEEIKPVTDLAEKLRDYLRHTAALQEENEVDDNASVEGTWLDQPIEIGQEGAESDWELNPLLRQLYQQYTAGKLAKRVAGNEVGPEIDEYEPLEKEEDDEENDIEEELSPEEMEEMEEEIENTLAGYLKAERLQNKLQREEEIAEDRAVACPALTLTDGCSFAVGDLGLKLDAEAMDLCNRHQLCYTCGSVHGMSAADCDNGYLNEANALCEIEGDAEDCSTDAAGLFILMMQSHSFNINPRDSPALCLNPCTIDYIIGIDTRK